jgi:folate-binding protein YgfZ
MAVADPWSWQPTAPARCDQPVSLLRLEGPDSLRFLHGQTSQDLERARPGQWLGTCCIGPTARMLALAEVLVDADGAWLAISAGEGAAVRQALDRVLFPADRVRLGALEPGLLVTPLGPDAAGSDLPDPAAAGHWCPLDPAAAGWLLGERQAVLLPAGAPLPAWLARRRPLEPLEQERRRISLGLPAVPGELNDDTNPFELGLAERVSISKGCYVGQETLARLVTYDGVKRQLRRWWVAPGQRPLQVGEGLLAADGSRAGRISSVLELPGEGWIGLALVRRAALEAPQLLAGEGAAAVTLQISTPAAVQPPPQAGTAAQAAGGAS